MRATGENDVMTGGVPVTVPDEIIESLRARQDPNTGACAKRSPFKPGAQVQFRAGPFAGLDGVRCGDQE